MRNDGSISWRRVAPPCPTLHKGGGREKTTGPPSCSFLAAALPRSVRLGLLVGLSFLTLGVGLGRAGRLTYHEALCAGRP